jgi:ABC-type Fe3+-hydroxamate transport system substrate-binding protein
MAPADPLDDRGVPVRVPSTVGRVVSLVPSLTESVAGTASGILVGATDWCTHPADLDVARVRGTKNPDLDAVCRLAPDVVLANDEENRADDIAELERRGLAVWVTGPRTVDDAFGSLDRMLTQACGLARPAWLDEAAETWAPAYAGQRRRAVCLIWRRPWMALGSDTFAGDMLRRLGVDNVLGTDPERYPKVALDALPAHDLVVLPDEPYAFAADDGPEAFPGTAVALVSGRHLTWYGPSLVEARGVLGAQAGCGGRLTRFGSR